MSEKYCCEGTERPINHRPINYVWNKCCWNRIKKSEIHNAILAKYPDVAKKIKKQGSTHRDIPIVQHDCFGSYKIGIPVSTDPNATNKDLDDCSRIDVVLSSDLEVNINNGDIWIVAKDEETARPLQTFLEEKGYTHAHPLWFPILWSVWVMCLFTAVAYVV